MDDAKLTAAQLTQPVEGDETPRAAAKPLPETSTAEDAVVTDISPRSIAQTLVNSLPPAQLLGVWFALTGVLRSVYQVKPQHMIDCVRGHMSHPDGSTEYAFAATKPVKVNI